MVTLINKYIENDSNKHAVNIVRGEKQNISDVKYLSRNIGRLWSYGLEPDWNKYYEDEARRKVSLPTYSFEKIEYPLGGDVYEMVTELVSSSGSSKTPDISEWFYVPTWQKSVSALNEVVDIPEGTKWLFFVDELGLGEEIASILSEKSQNVVIVSKGERFYQIDEKEIVINPSNEEDYELLINFLQLSNQLPEKIVHMWSITENDEIFEGREGFKKLQSYGLYSLVNLLKVIDSSSHSEDIDFFVITNGIQEIIGDEYLVPEKSTITGAIKVIPQEHPFISFRCIDVVLSENETHKEKLKHQLIDEFYLGSLDTVVGYRGNLRLVEEYKQIKLGEDKDDSSRFKEKGVYLITGGLGEIGLEIATYLSEKYNARLILTSRFSFPDRETWSLRNKEPDKNNRINEIISKVLKIEEYGAEILIVQADVSELDRMKEVVADAEKRYGKINGIIHSAGITKGDSFESVTQISMEQCEEQFKSKVNGLYVLEDIFNDQKLDCCYLLSSISTVLGGLSFIAYASANSFMDGFVRKYNRSSDLNWVSVCWDGMDSAKTKIGFERIFSLKDIDRIVVSTGGNLKNRIDKWVKREELKNKKVNDASKNEGFIYQPRSELITEYVPPKNDTEKKLVDIWQRYFGIDKIGIEDDFFELGGDSLKAMNIITILHKELNVNIPIKDLIENSTIKKIAELVDNFKWYKQTISNGNQKKKSQIEMDRIEL